VIKKKKLSREVLITRRGVLPNHVKASAVDYLTQELVFLAVKHHITASAGV
jgi:uncharacterized protein (DUF488 family)